MPVRAGEHSGWLGTGSLGSVAPGILMMKVINRNFLTLFLQNPRLSVSTYVEEQQNGTGKQRLLARSSEVSKASTSMGVYSSENLNFGPQPKKKQKKPKPLFLFGPQSENFVGPKPSKLGPCTNFYTLPPL